MFTLFISTLVISTLTISTLVFAESAPAAGASGAASAAAPDVGSGALTQGLMLVGLVAIFYFFILRPQNKRAKEQRDLISGLAKGDEIITSGGILGKIAKVTDDFLIVSIAEGTEVTLQKQAIAGVLPKGTLKSLS